MVVFGARPEAIKQEEVPTLSEPVLVLWEAAERPETVEAGTVKLVGMRGG